MRSRSSCCRVWRWPRSPVCAQRSASTSSRASRSSPISCRTSAATGSRSPRWSARTATRMSIRRRRRTRRGRAREARGRQRSRPRRLAAAAGQASGSKAAIVTASNGITPLQARARDADPHAWQSVANAKIYVANIRDALARPIPPSRGLSRQCRAYLAKLDALDARSARRSAKIPPDAPQGDHHPRCLRLFRRGLRHRLHRPAGRLDRDRAQRPRHRRASSARSGPRKSRRCFWKISATTG